MTWHGDVLVTVPMRNENPAYWAKFAANWSQWVYDYNDQLGYEAARIYLETTPNRMDVSISKCITLAKMFRCRWWVRHDGDVKNETPLIEDLTVARHLWTAFHAITGAPTVDRSGVGQWRALNDRTPDADRGPFECQWISGSLVFTPLEVVDALKPVSTYEQGESDLDMYINVQRSTTTEDYDYCERVRKAGFKVYAAPQILVRQRREDVGIPSYRPPMRMGQTVELPIQGVGVN